MNQDRWDSLLDRDWAAAWEKLPEAPALVPRSKTAQITLRVSSTLLTRIKRVAAAKALPYHALVRSWIIDGLRASNVPSGVSTPDEPFTEQLNIKLDQDVLDGLKARSDELRRPYHRLAREWVDVALSREEASLGLNSALA